MKHMERLLAEFQTLLHKAGILSDVKIHVIMKTERDKAYLVREILADLEPSAYTLTPIFSGPPDSVFRLAGIEVRIIA